MLVLETMNWPDEIREASFPVLDADPAIRPQELEMARRPGGAAFGGVAARGVPGRIPGGVLALIHEKVAGLPVEEAPGAGAGGRRSAR